MSIVLVVDDDENIRSTIVDILGMEGFATEAFPSAAGVVDRVRRGDVGLVVTDINMPDVDGLQLLHEVKTAERAAGLRIPVIVLSGVGSEARADEARRLGAFACFPKPFDIEAFVTAVGSALVAPKPKKSGGGGVGTVVSLLLAVGCSILLAPSALGAPGNPFLVESYLRQGRHENALKALEGFDVLSPHLMLAKGECLHELERPVEALAALRELIARHADTAEAGRARQLVLQILEEARDWEGELRELRSFLSAGAGAEAPAWRRLLAFTLVRVGRPEEALAELREAREPADLKALLDVLKETGRLEKYIEAEGAAERDPGRTRRLAELLLLAGRHAEARRLLDALVAAGAGDRTTLERLLAALDALREHRASIAVLERLVSLEPNELAWRQRLGDAWYAVGDADKAYAAWRGPLELAPRDEKAYASVASVLVEHKLLPRALDVLREGRATLGQPDVFASELCDVLAELGRLDEAARELVPLVPQDRDKGAELFARLAVRSPAAGSACRAALRAAIARTPAVADLYLVLDEVVRRTGDAEADRAAVVELLLANLAELTDELQDLAEQFRVRGRLAGALALRQFLDGRLEGDERLRNRVALAEVEHSVGRAAAALDHLRAVSGAAACPPAQRELALALEARILHETVHDLSAARALWKRLAAEAPARANRPGYAVQAARAAVESFLFEEAKAELAQLQATLPAPFRPEVAYEAGLLSALTGDLDGAEAALAAAAQSAESPRALDALDLLLLLVEHRAGASAPEAERKESDAHLARLVRLQLLLRVRALARYDAELAQVKPSEVPPALADEYLLLEARSSRARGNAGAERAALGRLVDDHRDSPWRDRALLELAGLLAGRTGDRAAAATALETHLLDYPDSIRADEARALLKTVNGPGEGTGTR